MFTNKFTGFPTTFLLLCLLVMTTVGFLPLQKRDNTLTPKEKKEGWKLLFDGKSTRGWRTFKDKPADGWAVSGGELVCKKDDVTNRADLITAEKYDNFELMFDWKIVPGGNSGVMYRVTEDNGATYESGPEYSLIDDEGYPDKLNDVQKSGADYDVHAPSALKANPVGEYNHSKLVVNNSHVEHWLNGEKVVEFELWSPEWDQQKGKSKWKDVKSYAMSKTGHIALQDHGGGAWFKNVKIRKL